MQLPFIHPYTKGALERDADGNLFGRNGNQDDVYSCTGGCYDFLSANPNVSAARSAYDEHYASDVTEVLTVSAVTRPWFDATVPWRKTMLQNLGSLTGRRVLLLGNGESYKEFYFLHLGAQVVFTDLSLVAVRRAKAVFQASELWLKHQDDIEFHAVDAMHLPFPDQSFDVIYGSKFVGFLEDMPKFFSDVARCLKPGGICRFADDAFSPAWERVRQSLVHPIKARFSKASGNSLAGVRSTSKFGFERESLMPLLEQCGFSRLVFVREYFFLRIAQLCLGKLLRWNAASMSCAKPVYLALKWLDDMLANNSWVRRNQLALTWGFDR
jgi:ubiquinone/menaquinone biosynthesis C-methylase UbiE